MKDIDEIKKDFPGEADRRGYFGIAEPEHLHANALSKITGGALGMAGCTDGLNDLQKLLTSKGTEHQEELLLLQVEVLNAVFVENVGRMHDTKMIQLAKLFGDVAFKAQNQCRRTIMALADLKNPKRTTFIKQQNNAVNQQVNNGVDTVSPGREDSSDHVPETKNLEKIVPNELMEEMNDVQRMDARAPTEAV